MKIDTIAKFGTRLAGVAMGALLVAPSATAVPPGPPAGLEGQVEVTNFPETQDVTVTNSHSNPVPVELRDRRRVTVNSFDLHVAAGETEVFDPFGGFFPLDAFFISVTGADRDSFIDFRGRENETTLFLRGETSSGIGQEDYTISLSFPIPVESVRLTCNESEGFCHTHFSITGFVD
jgi:hypothetical protein